MKKPPTFLLTVLLLLLPLGVPVQAASSPDVRLLRYPYPYQAAIAVCNDQHPAENPVGLFEAVHTLVNTRDRIPRGSAQWKLIFQDPAIDENPAWKDGIQGFGLPIGDSVWLYNDEIGVFSSFDEATGRPVPHILADGRNFADIIDRWIRLGWVDMLHGAGPGDISREAVRAGLAWLQAEPYRHMEVWTNHSITETPSDIEPDVQVASTRIFKNIFKVLLPSADMLHEDRTVQSLIVNPTPARFPPEQRYSLWCFSLIVVGSFSWFIASLAISRWRTRRNLIVSAGVIAACFLVLYWTPLHYALGDNPGTRYYNVDLVRAAGFRFVSPIAVPGSTQNNVLALRETSWNGRPTYLRPMKIDDGSSVWMFPRAYRGGNGVSTLEMLTKSALDDLVQGQGASILYTHWINLAPRVFSAAGLKGLEQLRTEFTAGRIWVDTASALLRFELVRTFLDYKVSDDGARLVIDLGEVKDPIGGSFVPSVAELRGISFQVPLDRQVEVHLRGVALPADAVEYLKTPTSGFVRIGAFGARS